MSASPPSSLNEVRTARAGFLEGRLVKIVVGTPTGDAMARGEEGALVSIEDGDFLNFRGRSRLGVGVRTRLVVDVGAS